MHIHVQAEHRWDRPCRGTFLLLLELPDTEKLSAMAPGALQLHVTLCLPPLSLGARCPPVLTAATARGRHRSQHRAPKAAGGTGAAEREPAGAARPQDSAPTSPRGAVLPG